MKKKIPTKLAKGTFHMTNILDEFPDGIMQAIHNSEMGGVTKIVYLMINKKDKYILKTVFCKAEAIDEIKLAKSEYEIAKECSELSINIARPLKMEEYKNEETGEVSIETLYEYGGENLVKKLGNVDCTELIEIAQKTIEPLFILETRGIFHSDIKPQNIVYNGKEIKIIDFGVSKDFESKAKLLKVTVTLSGKMSGFSCNYCPPEIFGDKKSFLLNKIDVYCWGITIYQLITGKSDDELYDELNAFRLPGKPYTDFLKIIQKLELKGDKDKKVTKWFIPILLKVLSYSPEQRPSFAELKKVFEDINRDENDAHYKIELIKCKQELGIFNKEIE